MVLYSQGYRADLETREVTKVGAFYVRGYPREASITLDGDSLSTGSWWPLQSGTLLGSVVPGTYRLHASAPGYRDWDADIVVRATLVTERKSLTLFPNEAVPYPLPDGIVPSRIAVVSDLDLLALGTGDGDEARVILDDLSIPGTYVGNADGRVITMSNATRGKTTTQLLRFQTPGQNSATTAAIRGEEVLGVFDDSVLVRESDRLVSAYDAATGARTVVASSSASTTLGTVLRTGRFDAWSEDAGSSSTLVISRRGSGRDVLRVKVPRLLSLQPSGDMIGALDVRGSLWLIDPENGSQREIGHRAGFAAWNPDGTSVMALVDGELEVIPLKKGIAHGVLRGVLGDPSARIGRVEWYPDDEHAFVEIGDELVFVDIINGAANEQHAYRIPRPADWTFDRDDLTIHLLDQAGSVSSYVLPD